jgi:Ca-activated chloride channel family protein
MKYTVKFTNLEVLSEVVGGRSWRRYVPPVLFAIALASLCVAVARPQTRTLAPKDGATIILVLDASLSMESTDVKPTRLGAAQAAVRSFLDRVPKRVRVGLVVFSGEAQVGAPPTTDRQLLRESVDSIGAFSGYGGTAIGDALVRAVELGREAVATRSLMSTAARRARNTRGLVSILFLSDGRQNRGIVPPLVGAQRAKAAGMPVYTIALGTNHARLPTGFGPYGPGPSSGITSRLLAPDPGTLRAIADITGGRFFAARSAAALRSAYAKLGSRLGRRTTKTEVTDAFVGGAAALLVAAGILSSLWAPRIP